MTHPNLDQLVELARRDRPAPGLLASVARSLRVPFVAVPVAAIVVPSTAAAGMVFKAGAGRLALLGWGTGGVVAASSVALAVALSQPAAPAPTAPAVPPSLAPAVQPANRPSAPLATEPALPSDVAVAASAPVRPAKDALSTWDEPQLIEKARRALSAEPRRALSLAQEHQRRFPAGGLAVEREVIVIDALARTGQTAEAKRRALAFQARHPKSIHLPRVHALLARLSAE